MSQLIIQANVLAILNQANGPTELRDPDGNLVGVFTPAGQDAGDWDMAEADRVFREESTRCLPTADLVARLKPLE